MDQISFKIQSRIQHWQIYTKAKILEFSLDNSKKGSFRQSSSVEGKHSHFDPIITSFLKNVPIFVLPFFFFFENFKKDIEKCYNQTQSVSLEKILAKTKQIEDNVRTSGKMRLWLVS